MIHKRFDHTRHLIWATFLLTVFAGPAVTNSPAAPSKGTSAMKKGIQHKPVVQEPVLNTFVATK